MINIYVNVSLSIITFSLEKLFFDVEYKRKQISQFHAINGLPKVLCLKEICTNIYK